MTMLALKPAELAVVRGPGLLSAIEGGPSLVVHRALHGSLPGRSRLATVMADLEQVELRGRGGAGFPFARKLATAAEARGRPSVVVNISEGEPPSSKDAALALGAPHLVLDGAVVAAEALDAREVHIAVPENDRPVREAMATAIGERSERLRWVVHRADDVFVAGQASAIIELMSGRPNRPVTTWQPAASRGYRGRPTLLSNAETYAQLALLTLHGVEAYVARGAVGEPGTTLLTVHDSRGRRVVEVEFGSPWHDVLAPEDLGRPALLGGYHGTWAAAGALRGLAVSRSGLAAAGLSLGAGVVLVPDCCPLVFASKVASYLATQSARRCGPCYQGLPALAGALERVASGIGGLAEVERLSSMVEGRGACAHPDGTARMVRSALARFSDEVDRHARGGCTDERSERR